MVGGNSIVSGEGIGEMRGLCAAVIAAGLLLFAAGGARAADDAVNFAVTGDRAWDSSIVAFGQRAGIFAKHGIKVNIAETNNSADNLQALISGSADVATVTVTTFIGAAVKGAPVKLISSVFRGTSDFLWYVRSDSPILSFSDIKERTTLGVSSLGASSFAVTSAMLAQYGVKGAIIPTGNAASGIVQVMTKQLDIGTNTGLLGVPELARGEIRIIAYGRDLAAMRSVSVRALAARNDVLGGRREVLVRFLRAYEETLDWMYGNPQAVQWLAEQAETSVDEAKRVVHDCYPQSALTPGEVTGLDTSIAQAVAFKRIPEAPTPAEAAAMVDVVWKP
jgi:NitT/TauT family transport system substrate-binding protein